jgi:hypothetical protein
MSQSYTERQRTAEQRMADLADEAIEAELRGDFETSLKCMREFNRIEAQLEEPRL